MTTKHKYLKVSRVFVNTVIYFQVPVDQVDAANSQFSTFEDENPGCHTAWVSGQGLGLGVAIDWADRAHVGY